MNNDDKVKSARVAGRTLGWLVGTAVQASVFIAAVWCAIQVLNYIGWL